MLIWPFAIICLLSLIGAKPSLVSSPKFREQCSIIMLNYTDTEETWRRKRKTQQRAKTRRKLLPSEPCLFLEKCAIAFTNIRSRRIIRSRQSDFFEEDWLGWRRSSLRYVPLRIAVWRSLSTIAPSIFYIFTAEKESFKDMLKLCRKPCSNAAVHPLII